MSALPSLLVLVLFAAPSAVISRQHFDRARHAFAQHDYRHALDDFTTAAETSTTEMPDLWFDIAQCHRNLGHSRQAVLAFQHYLSLKPDAPDRPKVEAMIVQLGGPPPAPPAPDPPPAEPPAPAATTTTNAPEPMLAPAPIAPPPPAPSLTTAATDPAGSPALVLTAPPAPPSKPRHRRWVVWTAVAGGVAVSVLAIGLGVGLGLDTHASSPSPSLPPPMLGSAATFDTRGR